VKKCKPSDCKGCVHFINIRTHPLFADFMIQDQSGKPIQFEGCAFHLELLFLRQIWISLGGVQSAMEGTRNATTKNFEALRRLAEPMQLLRLVRRSPDELQNSST